MAGINAYKLRRSRMTIQYYAGLDVHKDSILISVFQNNEREPLFEKEVPGDGKRAAEVLLRLQEKGTVIACYESGCTGFTLQRYFLSKGIECLIAATSRIPRRPGDRVKTDKRDARNLAKLLRAGEITAVQSPSIDDEAARDYLRSRDDIKRELKRSRQRLLSFVLRHGYRYSTTSYWTLKHRKWLKELSFNHPLLQETFKVYYYHIEELEDKLILMDDKIQAIAQSDRYQKSINALRCFRGIDYLTALSLVCETGDYHRFPNAESFMSYLGLVPGEHSSGDKRMQGGITKTGNTHLRRLLIEASWHYRHKGPAGKRLTARRKGQPQEYIAYADKALRRLQKKFSKIVYRGKLKQVAATAVARELAGFVWGMMTENIE